MEIVSCIVLIFLVFLVLYMMKGLLDELKVTISFLYFDNENPINFLCASFTFGIFQSLPRLNFVMIQALLVLILSTFCRAPEIICS